MNAYDTLEECLGAVCPALSIASIAMQLGLLAWLGVLFVWIGCGLCCVHQARCYPRLPIRPFVRGLFNTGLGLLWPLWLLNRAQRAAAVD